MLIIIANAAHHFHLTYYKVLLFYLPEGFLFVDILDQYHLLQQQQRHRRRRHHHHRHHHHHPHPRLLHFLLHHFLHHLDHHQDHLHHHPPLFI